MLGYILIDNKEKMKYQIGKRYEFKIGYVNAIDDFDDNLLSNIKNKKIIKIKIFDNKKHISNDFKLIKEINYNKFINSNNKKYQILSVVKNHERRIIDNFIKTNDTIKLESVINSGIHEYLDFLFTKCVQKLDILTSKNELSQIEYMSKFLKNIDDIEYNKNILSMIVTTYGRNKDLNELVLKYCQNDIANIGRPDDLDILIKNESQTVIDNILLNGRTKDIDKYINSDDYLSKKTISKIGIDKYLDILINENDDYYLEIAKHGRKKNIQILLKKHNMFIIDELIYNGDDNCLDILMDRFIRQHDYEYIKSIVLMHKREKDYKKINKKNINIVI